MLLNITITELSMVALFIMAVFSSYSLIKSKINKFLTFSLIPVILVTGIISAYAIFSLRGTPIMDIPRSENVEVVHIEIKKPYILLLAKTDDEQLPKFYALPYTKENARSMQDITERRQIGLKAEGKFQEVMPIWGTKKSDAVIKFVPKKQTAYPKK